MKAKIFARDLLPYRPYTKTSDIDAYYAHVASRCLEVMEYGNTLGMPSDGRRSFAIMMALYLEDIVSGLGIYQTFTEEMKARYGEYLPFYAVTPDTYVHEEINVADVCFLFWHRLQLLANADDAIISPLDPNIAYVGESIMTVLDQAYEEAPENERIQELMKEFTFRADDFLTMCGALRWFHYGCYLFAENNMELNSMIDQMQKRTGGRDRVWMVNYSYMLNNHLIFNSTYQLLSLTTAQWVAKILGRHTDVSLLSTIKVHPVRIYRYAGSDADDYLLEEVSEQKTVCRVPRQSVNLGDVLGNTSVAGGAGAADLLPAQYVSGELIDYGGHSWPNSHLQAETQEAADVQMERLRQAAAAKEEFAETYRKFTEKNNGEWLHFCKTKGELTAFLTEVSGLDAEKGGKFPPLNGFNGIMVYCTPQSGIGIMHTYCDCVAHPDNSFYDQQRAAADALGLLVTPEVVRYEVASKLFDEGLLPDANIGSILGPEHGREILKKNAHFIIDYFYHTYAERERQLAEEGRA